MNEVRDADADFDLVEVDLPVGDTLAAPRNQGEDETREDDTDKETGFHVEAPEADSGRSVC